IAPGSPWENGYIESFNARLRDELLGGEIFYTLKEARIIVESWRRHYNTVRPHGSLGYKPPAPEVFIPAFARAALQPQPAMPPALAPRPALHYQSTWTSPWGPINRFRSQSGKSRLSSRTHLERHRAACAGGWKPPYLP